MDSIPAPLNEFRPAPFWVWNDWIETDEIKRQINAFAEQGYGGFFIHPRIGLETPYLSEEWMDRVGEAVAYAKQRGIAAWLYDEDKWPSGYAGGIVPRLGPEYREKALCVSEGEIPYPAEEVEVLRVYAVEKAAAQEAFMPTPALRNEAGFELKDLRRIELSSIPTLPQETSVWYFYVWTSPLKYPWLNGTSYVDLLHPKVVEAFIESTHEKYARRIGHEFGKTVPGIFTDEPGYLMYGGRFTGRKNVLPWSPVLPPLFKDVCGYDLLDKLPHLFFRLPGHEKVRYQFRRVHNEQFVRNFSQRIGEWCERHGLSFTGHYLAEDPITMNLERCGAVMPHYVHQQIPGIDHLKRLTDAVVTQKQLQSVVNQFRKKRALCEIFGTAGQDFSFAGQKWVANWNLVNGVNLLNPHLSLYTMRGERKRDFPPTFSWQQPWWEYNHLCADYLTRICQALSQGERIIDVLVLHPIESGYILFEPRDKSRCDVLHDQFEKLLWLLLERQWDFDLGDEELIEQHGAVENGEFRIRHGRYRTVILPPMLTIRSSTLDLLEKFIGAGGQVLVVREFPGYVDGEPASERVQEKLRGARLTSYYCMIDDLRERLEAQVEAELVDGGPARTIFYHKRRRNGKAVYFFINNDPDNRRHVRLRLPEAGRSVQLDAMTGQSRELDVTTENGQTVLEYRFEGGDSLLLEIDPSADPAPVAKIAIQDVTLAKLDGPWDLQALDPNVLTIDHCRLAHPTEEFGEPTPCIEINRKLAGSDARGFRLEYAFETRGWKGGDVWLVLERPTDFQIRVNGQAVESKDEGYWRDIGFRKVQIGDWVKDGRNAVELLYKAERTPEVESIYLLGRFLVKRLDRRSFVVEPMPGKLMLSGDAVEAGLPFYAGKLALTRSFELGNLGGRVFLRLDKVNARAVTVTINGEKAGDLIWRPWEVEITSLVRPGQNELRLEIVNSLHNLLGPHHDARGEVEPFVGPGEFEKGAYWTDAYYFRPFGVGGAVILGIVESS